MTGSARGRKICGTIRPEETQIFSDRELCFGGEIVHHWGVDVGGPELLIILAVIVLLFGGSQVPKLAKGLGQARREFNAGLRGEADKDDKPSKPEPKDGDTPDKDPPA
jgi:sec-independent protein translocase protein TatA